MSPLLQLLLVGAMVFAVAAIAAAALLLDTADRHAAEQVPATGEASAR